MYIYIIYTQYSIFWINTLFPQNQLKNVAISKSSRVLPHQMSHLFQFAYCLGQCTNVTAGVSSSVCTVGP